MSTRIFAILCAACLGGGAAQAQSAMNGPEDPPVGAQPSGLSNSRFLTATGATVPKPNLLPPDVDAAKNLHRSYEKDRRIERSICSNC